MLKTVCLIRDEAPLIYFVNRIHECHGVMLAIVEYPEKKQNLWNRIKAKGTVGALYAILNRLKRSQIARKHILIHNRYFGTKWRVLANDIPILKVKDINSVEVVDHLKVLKPDLILDHGTSLVRDNVLKLGKLALNLHWGLSPYYRGTFCTQWALVNWDPFNIGVTIHKLTNIIDGGSILVQKRAEIGAYDIGHSINMQLTSLGTELMIKTIDKLEHGDELVFTKQNHSLGYLTRNSQYDHYIQKQVEHIEKGGFIMMMLEKPSRKQRLPIIGLSDQ